MRTHEKMLMAVNWLLVIACLGVLLTVLKKLAEKKSSNGLLPVKFIPGSKESCSGLDVSKCQAAWDNPSVDMSCQQNPDSDSVNCSDYPLVYCDGGLQPTGDLNWEGCQGCMAYSAAQCTSPLSPDNNSWLCGGTTGHSCNNKGCNESQNVPLNPWNATGVCTN